MPILFLLWIVVDGALVLLYCVYFTVYSSVGVCVCCRLGWCACLWLNAVKNATTTIQLKITQCNAMCNTNKISFRL